MDAHGCVTCKRTNDGRYVVAVSRRLFLGYITRTSRMLAHYTKIGRCVDISAAMNRV